MQRQREAPNSVVAHSKVIELLKTKPNGLTVDEIKTFAGRWADAVVDLLRTKSTNVVFDEPSQVFKYKSESLVGSVEDLHATVRNYPNPPLPIPAATLRDPPFSDMQQDVEVGIAIFCLFLCLPALCT